MKNYLQLWNPLGHGMDLLARSRSPRVRDGRRKPGRVKRVPRIDDLEGRTLLSVGLDPTFGYAGQVMLNYTAPRAPSGSTEYFTPTSTAIQADGKILVGGTADQYSMTGSGSYTNDLIVFRFNSNGTPDTSFGTSGYTVIPVTVAGSHVDSSGGYVALQPNGSILVGGSDSLTTSSTSSDNSDFVIARLTSSGALDTSFNTTGIQTVDIGNMDSLTGLALAPNGDIVAAGTTTLPSSYTDVFAVARLTPAGALDTSFNTTGKETINFTPATSTTAGSNDTASGLVVQPNGDIVVVGTTMTSLPSGGTYTSTSDFAVARLNTSGGLDTTFNGTGKETIAYTLGGDDSSGANAVALQSNGSIVLAGFATESSEAYNSTTQTWSGVTKTDLALVRLTTAGALDTTFGTGGKIYTQVASLGIPYSTVGNSLAIESDGEIVVGGSASEVTNNGNANENAQYALLGQYQSTGVLDPAYGAGGIALIPGDSATSIAVDSSGRVLYVDSAGTLDRTTPPAPEVVSATYTPVGTAKNQTISSVTITFNTKLNAALADETSTYKLRIGSKGNKYIKITKAVYDDATNSVTLYLKKMKVRSAKSGLYVIFTASGIHGANSEMLNGGNQLAVEVASTNSTALSLAHRSAELHRETPFSLRSESRHTR